MLLLLFDWLSGFYGGFRVFGYLTLRAILAVLTALAISLMVGPWMIRKLAQKQIGQVVRDARLSGSRGLANVPGGEPELEELYGIIDLASRENQSSIFTVV